MGIKILLQQSFSRVRTKLLAILGVVALTLFVFGLSTPPAFSVDLPSTLGYQGRLLNNVGTALTGAYNFTIRLYDAPAAGTYLWGESYAAVSVNNGYFTINLGSGGVIAGAPLYALLADVPFTADYYITTEVNGDGEMAPRTKFNSTGYAFKSGGIETTAVAPIAGLREGRTYFDTGTNTLYVYTGGAWVAVGGGGGGTLQTAYNAGNTIETAANNPVLITETGAGVASTGDLLQLTNNPGAGGTTAGDALQITLDAADANGNSGNGIYIAHRSIPKYW